MKLKNLIFILIIGLVLVGGCVEQDVKEEKPVVEKPAVVENNTKLVITKSYDIKGLNSLTYDGEYLWGLAGKPSYSGTDYKKRIIKINKNNGEIEEECAISFAGGGITFAKDFLWVTDQKEYYGPDTIYKINPRICIKKEECNQENNCIVNSWNIEADELWGLTCDGKYLYIINENRAARARISKYDFNGEFIKNVITSLGPVTDITWDGKYFWTIEWNSYLCAGFCTPPSNHYDIRAYNKDWKEVFHQRFEIGTPVWYGITWDGENLWISDGYNDRISQLSILKML